MKKLMPLAASILLILVASLFTTVGTMAYFADAETSVGNSVAAGTLDLQVDDQDDPNVAHMTIEDMKPGDTVNLYWNLTNVGSVCGQPSIEIANIVNYENGRTEPEKAVDATGGNPGAGNGELGGTLYVQMRWQTDDGWKQIRLVPWGDTFLNNLAGPYGLGEIENDINPIPELCEGGMVSIELRLFWMSNYSADHDNARQSDSVTFDVIFNLEQA